MDKKHRLSSPNNDSLKGIEQVTDRSELSTLYYKPHDEWEGKELLTPEQREEKRHAEHRATVRSVRKKFWRVGILLPLPVVTLAILISLASIYITFQNPMFEIPFIIIVGGIWAVSAFHMFRRAFAILYSHTLGTVPFFLIFMILLGLGTQALFLLTRGHHTESLLLNTLFISGSALVVSVLLCGLLLLIWTSERLTSGSRLVAIGGVALALLVIISFAMFN